MKYRKGDRVVDGYLGSGIVKKIHKDFRAYSVLFDKTPEIEYNMGANPAFVFESELRKESELTGELKT